MMASASSVTSDGAPVGARSGSGSGSLEDVDVGADMEAGDGVQLLGGRVESPSAGMPSSAASAAAAATRRSGAFSRLAIGHAPRGIRDAYFLVLFVAANAVVFIIAGAVGEGPSGNVWLVDTDQDESGAVESTKDLFFVGAILAACIAMSWVVMVSLPHVRHRLLHVSQVLAGSAMFFNAFILLLASPSRYVLACVILATIAADTLWVIRARASGRVKFAEVLLDVVLGALRTVPAASSVMIGCLVVNTVYTLMWGQLFVGVMRTGGNASLGGDVMLFVILAVMLRWTTQVLKGIVRVAVSGSIAEWLKLRARESARGHAGAAEEGRVVGGGAGTVIDDDDAAAAPGTPGGASAAVGGGGGDGGTAGGGGGGGGNSGGAMGAAATAGGATASGAVLSASASEVMHAADARAAGLSQLSSRSRAAVSATAMKLVWSAVTVQLGSICAGALAGAFTPVLWGILRASRRAERSTSVRVSRAAVGFSRWIEAWMRVSHKYAHVQVAEQGKPWFVAARDTWDAFGARGVEAVVQEDASDRLLLFGCYLGGAVLALIMGVTVHANVRSWVLVGFVVFWFGFSAVSLALTPIEAAVSALIVCFAEKPRLLSQMHPIIFHRLTRVSEVRHFQRFHHDSL